MTAAWATRKPWALVAFIALLAQVHAFAPVDGTELLFVDADGASLLGYGRIEASVLELSLSSEADDLLVLVVAPNGVVTQVRGEVRDGRPWLELDGQEPGDLATLLADSGVELVLRHPDGTVEALAPMPELDAADASPGDAVRRTGNGVAGAGEEPNAPVEPPAAPVEPPAAPVEPPDKIPLEPPVEGPVPLPVEPPAEAPLDVPEDESPVDALGEAPVDALPVDASEDASAAPAPLEQPPRVLLGEPEERLPMDSAAVPEPAIGDPDDAGEDP